MNAKDLIRLGVPEGASIKLGMYFIVKFIGQGGDPSRIEQEVAAIVANPAAFLGDPLRETFARSLYDPGPAAAGQREKLAPWRQCFRESAR